MPRQQLHTVEKYLPKHLLCTSSAYLNAPVTRQMIDLLWDSVEKKDSTDSHERRGKGIAVRIVPGQGTGAGGVLGHWHRLRGKGRGGCWGKHLGVPQLGASLRPGWSRNPCF